MQSRQKSYADNRRKDLSFEVGDHVFLKVSPLTGVRRSIRLPGLHNMFHVSQLKKYQPDLSHMIKLEEIEIQKKLTYQTEPNHIVDAKEKQLRNKVIQLVKVIWKGIASGDATWEIENQMRKEYPQLFF
ncbi:uncharacterized protein LOC129318081 [Prosopis cineraria]|uniref:uncharacterized protein LOC129318081 n=1 Tax=Prosopis cineraria TaxID=364024 RepID=UPI002410263C|nr:uncharacterized protein LOC129318081 [Prosopis cineraria]